MSNDSAAQQPSSRPNFPQMEEEISLFWEKHRIFERSIEERPEGKSFVFYDGPPFATGLPHYGHLLQSALKDVVPRYATMQGYRVARRWGWDCHGLPIENLIEKKLNLDSKRDIESYGIEKFNLECYTTVMQYAEDWKKYIRRFGRWVDMDNGYKTMDASYVESVWWAFSELWKKKLVYKDLRVSLYCPRCSTPLSNTEIASNNSYIEAEDPSITIKFKVKGEEDTFILAWTTTPWTLPANIALAVHPEAIYLRVKMNATGETLIFGEALLSKVLRQYFPLDENGAPFEVLSKIKGSELVGMEYEPLYPMTDDVFAKMSERSGKTQYQVVDMEYVLTDDGTGIVHTAPGFGEEDFQAAKAHDLPVLVTVDEMGQQKTEIAFVAGKKIKESDPIVIADLEARGLLFRNERKSHSVAVCWRCATTLLYKAQPAWFVNVTKAKPKMVETAKKISWHPDHFKAGRFGKGIETAPDWCISRTRYWGAPMPVWMCTDCNETQVFGSIKELETALGKSLDVKADGLKLHRPYIDDVTLACACGGKATRIPEVLDTWFDSGSMPYASVHYPFENKTFFEENFPADFIAEAQDQTRGWFYTMHTLSSALFGKAAFKDVICTGLIMAEDGKKMSKSLKNYPDPWELMTKVGADSLRMYMLSSPVIQAEQLNFAEKDVETIQRTLFGTLWNVRAFYLMYAGTEKIEITKPRSTQVLDRWLMSRLSEVTSEMTKAMDGYDIVGATRPIRKWVDDLSTWWLRRSRERMKSDDAYDKLDALRTLREALIQTSQLLAPFTPFFAEKLYQDLDGAKMSVHLDRWPKSEERIIDTQLIADMQWVRDVAAEAHESRAVTKMPVRQALASLTVTMRDTASASRLTQRSELLTILRDEVNVEKVIVLGGGEMGEADRQIELDTKLTPELKKKGLARELARHLMNLRKQLGLTPADRIAVAIGVTDFSLREMIESLSVEIEKDVRADAFLVGETLADGQESSSDLVHEGVTIQLGIKKA